MYKDNASLAKANAGIARGIIKRASADGVWSVGVNDDEDVIKVPIVDTPQEIEDTVEVEVQEEKPQQELNEQTEEDTEFLASLMEKIEEPDEKTAPVEEEGTEDKLPMSDTPDFDPDEVMFK